MKSFFSKRMMGSILVMLIFHLSVFAQEFPSRWTFGKAFASEENIRIWKQKSIIKANIAGEGVLKAVDADGNPLKCNVVKARPIAGPLEEGDCFLFQVPVQHFPAGSFLTFDATFAVEPDGPMVWLFEWKDGDKWIPGREFICHGPAFGSKYTYTSIYQAFKLESPIADGSVEVRLRALGGSKAKASDEALAPGCASFAANSFVGVYIQDFGTEEPIDTTRVLCIGNSFTYYHSCPTMLKEIAWNEGHYLDMTSSLKGGRTMKQHQTLVTTIDAVKAGDYDVVFLQDQSQAAARLGKDAVKYASLVNDLDVMAKMIKEESPECSFFLEWTWAFPAKEYGGFGSLKNFDDYAEKGIQGFVDVLPDAEVSPIGKAFRLCREEHPDIMLYHTDGHHQSEYGSYLKSCINYLMIFGEPFGDNPSDCGLDGKKAAVLRRVAEKIVLETSHSKKMISL